MRIFLWAALVFPVTALAVDLQDDIFEPILEIDLRQDSSSAAEQNKQLMIMFTKKGCAPCAQMKAETLADGEVRNFISKNMLAYHVDIYGDLPILDADNNTWTEKTYAKKEGIWGTPAFYYFNKDGRRIYKHVGFMSKQQFIETGEKVMHTDSGRSHLANAE